MSREIWKVIPHFKGYQISNLGRVKSCRWGTRAGLKFGKWRLVTPHIAGKYLTIDLVGEDKNRHAFCVHRLLYELFVSPVPKGLVVDHIDRNSLNNEIENLRLATVSQNVINSNKRHYRKYKGVRLTIDGKWEARNSYKGQAIYLGRFLNEQEAAIAFNNYAKTEYAEFAYLNDV